MSNNAIPNAPEETTMEMLIHDDLRELQREFAKHLKSRLKDTDNPPSHQELSVIRATLRDNGMVLKGPSDDDLKDRARREAAGLPEFDDDEYDA